MDKLIKKLSEFYIAFFFFFSVYGVSYLVSDIFNAVSKIEISTSISVGIGLFTEILFIYCIEKLK